MNLMCETQVSEVRYLEGEAVWEVRFNSILIRHQFDINSTGSLGGAARRMRLHNAKRKFRRGIRAIMAANLLSHLLAGLEKEKVLVSIGQVYDEARLRELYEVFGQRAAAESHDDEREGNHRNPSLINLI